MAPFLACVCRPCLNANYFKLLKHAIVIYMWYNVFQHIYVALILLLRKRILQKSQPPLYPCQLSEYVCSGGGVRHIGYTCERMENEKYSTLQPNWIFNIHDCGREQILETRIKTKFWIQTKTVKSSFETFLALDLALVEMHKPAITLKGNFLLFNISTTIHNFKFFLFLEPSVLVLIAKWLHHRICMTCSITSAPIDWWGVSSLFCRKLVWHVCGQLAFHQVNFCRSVSFDNTYLPS